MISVVVPVFNEKESLMHFYKRLKPAIVALGQAHEIIFVDDGSTDDSLDILKNLSAKDKNIRIFSFRHNQGKAEALTLGFQKARGERIITLDADLQDQPEEMYKLLNKLSETNEVVCGWRKERKDAVKMKVISKFWNFITGIMWGVKLHDYNCGLKAYTKEAAKSLHLYGGMHRFIPLLAAEQGFSISEVPVMHDKRQFGKSKYGFSKILNIPDMFTLLFLTKYGKRPLHFFSIVGSIFAIIGTGILFYFWIIHTFFAKPVEQRPLFYIGMIGILAGLQIFFTGFLADLLISIFHQSQVASNYIVQKHLLKYIKE